MTEFTSTAASSPVRKAVALTRLREAVDSANVVIEDLTRLVGEQDDDRAQLTTECLSPVVRHILDAADDLAEAILALESWQGDEHDAG